MSKTTTQLQLPYEVISETLGRDKIRGFVKSNGQIKLSGRQTISVPFELLSIRDGFNVSNRYSDEKIKEMAESLHNRGQLEPIYVDFLSDGRIVVERGHRRYYAFKYNIDNGIMSGVMVECFANHANTTELDRLINLYTSNMHYEPLTPLQQSEVAHRIKSYFNIPNQEIAELLNVSRQKIDYLIKISELPDETKKLISDGELSINAAIDLIKKQKEAKKKADDAEINASKTSAAAPAPAPDPLQPEIDELKNLETTDPEDSNDIDAGESKPTDESFEEMITKSEFIDVPRETMSLLIGKRLSWPIYHENCEDGRPELPDENYWIAKNTVLTEELLGEIVKAGVQFFYIYKPGAFTAPSVITVKPDEDSGDGEIKFDESREEIKLCQNVIKNLDKISVIADKLQNDQAGKDISNYLNWIQKDMAEIRLWIHKNKKQNKAR